MPLDDDQIVAVSPRHSVRLAREFADIMRRPQKSDYVVRTIQRHEANDLVIMSAEIVVAGRETRERHPLAVTYPLHFRKTYSAARLNADPAREFENQTRASEILGLPPPIGFGPTVFRSCLIPGRPYSRHSPFGVDPEDRNIGIAQKLPLAAAAGLWGFAEGAMTQLSSLHAAGFTHGDAELHNFVVCAAPLELLLVDFEAASTRGAGDDAAWKARCDSDLSPLLREAVFLQCALGRQRGPLADACERELGRLFRSPERFRRAIDFEADPGQ